MPDAAEREERIRQALQLLIDEVRERIDRHPLGHLVAGRGEQIDLRLSLPTALRDGQIGKAGRDASESLQEAVQGLLHHSSLFQPGRVLCLRCQTAACEHSAPADGRQVFAGWGPAGLPRFVDFGQWLLQRRDPRVDLLYRDSPQRSSRGRAGGGARRRPHPRLPPAGGQLPHPRPGHRRLVPGPRSRPASGSRSPSRSS